METYNSDVAVGIEQILKEYESTYNITIFFACDTGSRSLGVAVSTSDFDLNGFFIPHYKEYLKICRKSKEIIAKQGIKFKVNDQQYELDLQLWDIKDWLKEKIEKNVLGCDFWFESPIIFRNLHPEIINEIKSLIEPPFYYFWGKYKNNLELCLKDIKKEGTQNKKIMNTLIYAIQYLHTRVLDGFPKFNIFEEMKIFEEKKENILGCGLISSEELYNLLECFKFIEVCYEEKKKSRKGLTKNIPECVRDLDDMLCKKFQAKPKKCEIVNVWNGTNSQEIFDKLLNIYKK